MYNVTFGRHAWRFEDICVFVDKFRPARRFRSSTGGFRGCTLLQSLRTSTRACLHGSHVASGVQQHQPRLATPTQIPLKLRDTTQFNLGNRCSGQRLQSDIVVQAHTLHRHGTCLPIDHRVRCLQPIDTQHNVVVQFIKYTTLDHAVQSPATFSTHNQRDQARVRRRNLTSVSQRHLHTAPWLHR